jgi:hypothetical protein
MTVSIRDFDAAVQTFKAAWEAADQAGLVGHRVQSGVQALINAGWGPHSPNQENRS